MMEKEKIPMIEIRTLGLLACVYAGFALSTMVLAQYSVVLAFVATSFLIAQHSSLQHEAVHGHPTRSALLNELLVFVPVGLFIPYGRFRDLHLAHHVDEILTDPYDDPESNYFDPEVWNRLHVVLRLIFRINNTLLGRIILGPFLSVVCLLRADMKAIGSGDSSVLKSWVLHAIGFIPLIFWLANYSTLPFWVYFSSAYFGLGLLKIRTYLEHRANDCPKSRTVIIEDRGVLAFLFLNNNYHVVHHRHPSIPWYHMQKLYYADPDKYQARNGGYIYSSYWEIFRKYLLKAKDPVPHPLR